MPNLACTSVPSSMSQGDWSQYLQYSSNTPHMVAEVSFCLPRCRILISFWCDINSMQYAGGFYDSPGGPGYANCPYMLDPGVFRLFYKDLSAMSVTSLNIYMVGEPIPS